MALRGRLRRTHAATFDEITRDYERNPTALDWRVQGATIPPTISYICAVSSSAGALERSSHR